MSRARFAAHFTDVVGQPAIEYLAHWRLSLAQTLLTQGRQVKSIADEVGYGSPNALTRAFTQRIGQTPTDWLAQHFGGGLHLEEKFLAPGELAELSTS